MHRINCDESRQIYQVFYDKWKENKIVLDTWFYYSASVITNDFEKTLNNLFYHKNFDKKSPNTIRSILNGFVSNNSGFHSVDGKGYNYVAEKLIEFDKFNPIVVSRFLKIFSRWDSYVDPYKEKMLESLKLIDRNDLSKNSREVIDMILKK